MALNSSATSWLLAVLLFTAGTGPAPAQTAETSKPQIPDPAALAADWWIYFQSAGDERAERVDALEAQLDALSASLTEVGEREDRLRGLIIEVGDLAARYDAVLSKEPPAPPPTAPAPETYTIEELLSLAADRREAAFDRDLEREDVERTARLHVSSTRRIDDAKAAYLALPATAPERVERGLELMRNRFAQGISEADLKLRRVVLERVSAKAERLAAELERAGKNLRAQPGEADAWAERAARAEEERQRLEAEAANARVRAGRYGEEVRERAQRRRLEQRLLGYEARIAAAAIEALQAELAGSLVEQLSSPSEGTLETLRERRKALDARLDQLKDGLEVWRRATDRERSAAMAQLAEAGATDSSLAELHRSRVARADETTGHINQLNRLLAEGRTLSQVAGGYIVEEAGVTTDLTQRAADALEDAWAFASEWSRRSLFSINETPVTAIGLLRVVIILVVAWWASRLLRGGLERLMQRRETMSRASLYTLGRLSHYTILVIAFMIALSSIGIDFTKFALFVSALGVGLGFGLQAIFSNFVAGLIILFEKSLKVGDFVELESGLNGEVREINIRGTLITTNDNIDILVPNSEFVSGRVTNWTLREAHRRVRISFGVAYGTDKDLVRQAVLEAAANVPFTFIGAKAREPQVWLVGFGDSSLDFELVVWLTQDAVKRPGAVHAAYNWAIETALGEHGIEIPFPQRDLHIRSYFGQRDADGLRTVDELVGRSLHVATAPGG